jgi:hypothetical protein
MIVSSEHYRRIPEARSTTLLPIIFGKSFDGFATWRIYGGLNKKRASRPCGACNFVGGIIFI